MISKKLLVASIAVVAIGATALWYSTEYNSAPAFIDPADRALVIQGKTVYANNCASCHGAELQGQNNWRERLPNGRLLAPPHDETGHTWHHPDGLLFDIIKNGLVPGRTAPPNYESDMPAYAGILSDEEITAVLAYIKSSWPPKVLQAQKEMTLQQRK